MAKILCVDDYRMYAEMVGTMLEQRGGHEVKVDVVPLVVDEILAYAPDIIVINLVRKAEVLGSPVHDFYREVDGAKAVVAISGGRADTLTQGLEQSSVGWCRLRGLNPRPSVYK